MTCGNGWRNEVFDLGGDLGGEEKSLVVLKDSSQASPYANNKFPSTNAFVAGGGKFTHTNKGVGMWWRASF